MWHGQEVSGWLGDSEMQSVLEFLTWLFMSPKLPFFCNPKTQAVGIPNKSRRR